MQIGAQRRQPLCLCRFGERQDRLRRYGLQPCEGFAGLVAESVGDVLGKAQDPAIRDLRRKAESMRRRRRNENHRRRRKVGRCGLETHLTTTPLYQQNLKEIAMAMGADRPIVNRRA